MRGGYEWVRQVLYVWPSEMRIFCRIYIYIYTVSEICRRQLEKKWHTVWMCHRQSDVWDSACRWHVWMSSTNDALQRYKSGCSSSSSSSIAVRPRRHFMRGSRATRGICTKQTRNYWVYPLQSPNTLNHQLVLGSKCTKIYRFERHI